MICWQTSRLDGYPLLGYCCYIFALAWGYNNNNCLTIFDALCDVTYFVELWGVTIDEAALILLCKKLERSLAYIYVFPFSSIEKVRQMSDKLRADLFLKIGCGLINEFVQAICAAAGQTDMFDVLKLEPDQVTLAARKLDFARMFDQRKTADEIETDPDNFPLQQTLDIIQHSHYDLASELRLMKLWNDRVVKAATFPKQKLEGPRSRFRAAVAEALSCAKDSSGQATTSSAQDEQVGNDPTPGMYTEKNEVLRAVESITVDDLYASALSVDRMSQNLRYDINGQNVVVGLPVDGELYGCNVQPRFRYPASVPCVKDSSSSIAFDSRKRHAANIPPRIRNKVSRFFQHPPSEDPADSRALEKPDLRLPGDSETSGDWAMQMGSLLESIVNTLDGDLADWHMVKLVFDRAHKIMSTYADSVPTVTFEGQAEALAPTVNWLSHITEELDFLFSLSTQLDNGYSKFIRIMLKIDTGINPDNYISYTVEQLVAGCPELGGCKTELALLFGRLRQQLGGHTQKTSGDIDSANAVLYKFAGFAQQCRSVLQPFLQAPSELNVGKLGEQIAELAKSYNVSFD